MAGKAERFVHPMLRQIVEGLGGWLHNNKDSFPGMNEPGPDYVLALSLIQIEVKNSERDGTLADAPSEIQRKLLDKHGGWVFLVMWDKDYPRLPNGADAYFVPWPVYKDFWDELSATKGKSIRRHATPRAFGADDYLGEWKLPYAGGGWIIPPGHAFWDELYEKAKETHERAKEIFGIQGVL